MCRKIKEEKKKSFPDFQRAVRVDSENHRHADSAVFQREFINIGS